MVPILVRPRSSRWRTAAAAPPAESTPTIGMFARPSGRSIATTGMFIRCRLTGNGSAPCIDAIITPSTCRARAYCSMRSWLAAELAIISTRLKSASSSSWLTPRTMPGKNGSSEKTRVAGSGNTSAIEPVRWVARLRAAALGT